MRRTRPIFIVSPSFPGVFAFSEPDGAPWVLGLPQAGVRAGYGREESHLDLLPHKEDLSLNIKVLATGGVSSRYCLRWVSFRLKLGSSLWVTASVSVLLDFTTLHYNTWGDNPKAHYID